MSLTPDSSALFARIFLPVGFTATGEPIYPEDGASGELMARIRIPVGVHPETGEPIYDDPPA